MTEPSSPASPANTDEPIPVFRIAFAIVGSLLFGATTLVGLATLFAGGYTTTLHCDRASGSCVTEFRSATKKIPLAEIKAVERRRDDSERHRSPSQGVYLVHTSGQAEFLCSLPDSAENAAHLDTLVESTHAFFRKEAPSLELRCEGKIASTFDGVLMTALSAILAAANLITLARGVRRLLGHKSRETASGDSSENKLK